MTSKCSVCGKHFKDDKGVLQHGKDFHKKRVLEVVAIPVESEDDDMSEADYLIEKHY